MRKPIAVAAAVLTIGAVGQSVTAPPARATTAAVTVSATASQRQALRSAKTYLRTMAFSRKGLTEQLEFAHFSHSDAAWAVGHVHANWNAEAAQAAKTYLRVQSFSRQGLVDQLEFDGFTHAQAVYGAKKAYR